MEGELIDIERDQHLAGKTIHIFNYLDDTKKIAVVQEIDLAEREILVDYEDGTQEWIGVDGRKIRFPPIHKPEEEPVLVTKKRRSSKKHDTSEPSEKNSVVDTTKSIQNSYKAGSIKKSSTNSSKMVNSSKSYSNSNKVTTKSSGFLRLKFKTNEKPTKTSTKIESSKKRKRTEEVHDYTFESVNSSNETSNLVDSGYTNAKKASKKSKESKKEMSKLKIKLGKKEASVLNSENNTLTSHTLKTKNLKREANTSELSKESTKQFGSSISEKKIKTLLPKRSISESSSKAQTRKSIAESKLTSSPVTPPETLTPLRPFSSLPSAYSSGNTTPTLTLSPTSAGYICPKQYCKKPPFRTENLLMMHIKHYHKEYRNMLSSMPNVADLAYARTVGEQIESPQAGCLEKIAQIEEGRLKDKIEDETLHQNSSDLDNADKTLYQSCGSFSKGNKRTSMSKRHSGSEPSSPKVSVLVAQLQEPPLVAPSISIQSENLDAELSVSQHKLALISSPQFSDLSNSVIDSDEKQSDEKRSPTKKRRMSQLESSDVINCLCGYGIEDGLMVQCVLCQCWQHGMCMNFENEADVPPNYTCETCQFPKRGHSSRKYMYVQNWLREGVIPSYRFNKQREEVSAKRGQFLKASHDLLCELTELKHAVVNLQVKIQVLRQTPDHPKLYLWAKSWNDKMKEEEETQQTSDGGPVPEDAINSTHCRKHLSQHIEEEVQKADTMLKNIEKRIEELEKIDGGDNNEEEEDEFNQDPEKYTSVAKQTLLMMLRDLSSLQTLKYCERGS